MKIFGLLFIYKIKIRFEAGIIKTVGICVEDNFYYMNWASPIEFRDKEGANSTIYAEHGIIWTNLSQEPAK